MQSKMWIVPAIGLVVTLSAPVVGQEPVDEVVGAVEAELVESSGNAFEPDPLESLAEMSDEYWVEARPIDYKSWRIKPAEYPLDLWKEGPEGVTSFGLTIDETGKPTSCEVIDTSGDERLDRLTCAIMMERSVFEPAVENGVPIEGQFIDSHYWVKREPEFSDSFAIRIKFDVEKDGNETNCEVLEVSGPASSSFPSDLCQERQILGRPYRDENGVPVAKTVTLELKVTVEDVPQ